MKNKFLLFLLVLCLAFFVACNTSTEEDPTAPSTQTSSTVSTESESTSVTEPVTEEITETTTEEVTEPVTDAPLRSSDFTTELYSVTKIDGVCYLNFHDGNQFTPTGDESLDYVFIGIYYDSYEELRDTFLNGKLSTGTINTIKQQFSQSTQGIAVLDIVNMGKPLVPADCTIVAPLTWTGKELSCGITSQNYETFGFLFLQTDDLYQEYYAMFYENLLESSTVISTSESTYEDSPCLIYRSQNGSEHYLDVKIELPRGDQTFYIHMRYPLGNADATIDPQTSAPSLVSVFSECHGQKYFWQQYNFKEAPTLEWLTSFVLAPVSDESPTTS